MLLNVKFNDVPALVEVDVSKLLQAGGEPCQAVDVIVNFDVSNFAKSLKVRGHPDSVIFDGQVNLKFCSSGCESGKEASTFQVSAFSVVRLGDIINLKHSLRLGRGYTPEATCSNYNANQYECKIAGCEYNLISQNCIPGGRGKCSSLDINTSLSY